MSDTLLARIDARIRDLYAERHGLLRQVRGGSKLAKDRLGLVSMLIDTYEATELALKSIARRPNGSEPKG